MVSLLALLFIVLMSILFYILIIAPQPCLEKIATEFCESKGLYFDAVWTKIHELVFSCKDELRKASSSEETYEFLGEEIKRCRE